MRTIVPCCGDSLALTGPAPLADAHIAAIDAAEPPEEGATWRPLTTANALRLFPQASR
ncbi:hypothetical protein [Streptomyces sp. NPDC050528]|uniref:hypothetical protein n=1 Tax=unclassified Streptomyces TaxID=2593676 RepID=UPI0037900AC4